VRDTEPPSLLDVLLPPGRWRRAAARGDDWPDLRLLRGARAFLWWAPVLLFFAYVVASRDYLSSQLAFLAREPGSSSAIAALASIMFFFADWLSEAIGLLVAWAFIAIGLAIYDERAPTSR
jgi:hypothetical protein